MHTRPGGSADQGPGYLLSCGMEGLSPVDLIIDNAPEIGGGVSFQSRWNSHPERKTDPIMRISIPSIRVRTSLALLLIGLLSFSAGAAEPDLAGGVDTHFHVISPENWKDSRLAALGVIDGPIDGTAAKDLLDTAGFDKAVVISSAYLIPDSEQAKTENDYTASLVKSNPGRFYGMCSVSVHHEGALEEVARCVNELGLSGLKMHMFADSINLNDPQNVALIDGFFKQAASLRKGLPVLIDFNWMDDSQTTTMMQLAMTNPDTTIIMAHGLGHHFAELINIKIFREALGMDLGNLYIDISATLLNYPPDSPPFENYIWHLRELGADRILLGSDYPAVTPERTLEGFLKMGWTVEEKGLILKANAERLFGN
jgi:predicted TIM-barrel fold metal-dependent hydrolase